MEHALSRPRCHCYARLVFEKQLAGLAAGVSDWPRTTRRSGQGAFRPSLDRPLAAAAGDCCGVPLAFRVFGCAGTSASKPWEQFKVDLVRDRISSEYSRAAVKQIRATGLTAGKSRPSPSNDNFDTKKLASLASPDR